MFFLVQGVRAQKMLETELEPAESWTRLSLNLIPLCHAWREPRWTRFGREQNDVHGLDAMDRFPMGRTRHGLPQGTAPLVWRRGPGYSLAAAILPPLRNHR